MSATSLNAFEQELQYLAFEVQVFSDNLLAVQSATNSLQRWNKGFGRMVDSISLVGKALKETPSIECGDPILEQPTGTVPTQDDDMMSNVNCCVPNEVPSTLKRTRSQPTRTANSRKRMKDRWEGVLLQISKLLPKRFLSKKEDSRRLETVWKTVAIKPEGASLSDIVKVCNCSVLQANDCLSALVKVQVIIRKKGMSGLRYILKER